MFLIDDLLAIKAGGKIIPALVGAGVVAVGGFAAAEIYEHSAPWGLGPKLERLRDSIPGKLAAERTAGRQAGIKAQTDVDAPAFRAWATRLTTCQGDLKTQRDTAARAITKAEANQSASTAAAYRLGRATCGATDAPPPPLAADSGPPRLVLRPSGEDLGAIVNSAATPTLRP